jgi:hypothetical protein
VTNRTTGATCGGGAVMTSGGTFSNCNILFNRSAVHGAGVYGTVTKLYNCTFIGNRAASVGGGLSVNVGFDMQYCSFVSNSCGNWGGGISMDADLTVTIRNCLFRGNTAADKGGAISWRVTSNNSILESCTIVSNVASGATYGGGGVYFYMPVTNNLIRNCIIYFNTANNGGRDVDNPYSTGRDPSLTNRIEYCCINTTLVNAVALLTADPSFRNPAGGDYRLKWSSPCVNSGTNQTWMTNAVDLVGSQRILGPTVDRGCYEAIPPIVGTMVILR